MLDGDEAVFAVAGGVTRSTGAAPLRTARVTPRPTRRTTFAAAAIQGTGSALHRSVLVVRRHWPHESLLDLSKGDGRCHPDLPFARLP